MRRAIPALAASLLCLPAFAAPMPNMVPTHDVTGTYLLTGRGQPQSLAVEYSKSAGILRLTMPGGQGYVLYDVAGKDAKMVMPQMQRYMDYSAAAAAVAARTGSGGGNGDDVSITTGGTETIAGHDCTDSIATDHTRNKTETFCVTPDGVILSMVSSDGSSIVAQSISYAAVPEADIEVPPGYTLFSMPQMPIGVGNMPTSAMSGMPLGSMGGMSGPGGAP